MKKEKELGSYAYGQHSLGTRLSACKSQVLRLWATVKLLVLAT